MAGVVTEPFEALTDATGSASFFEDPLNLYGGGPHRSRRDVQIAVRPYGNSLTEIGSGATPGCGSIHLAVGKEL